MSLGRTAPSLSMNWATNGMFTDSNTGTTQGGHDLLERLDSAGAAGDTKALGFVSYGECNAEPRMVRFVEHRQVDFQ